MTVYVEALAHLDAQRGADVDVLFMACLLLGERLEQRSEILEQMGNRHETRQLVGIFRFAVGNALVLSFLLSGCASGRPVATSAATTNTWGRCDQSRMVTFMFFCRQTTAPPTSDLTR